MMCNLRARQDAAGSGHICSDYAPGELLEKRLTHAVHEHLFNETSSLAALPVCPPFPPPIQITTLAILNTYVLQIKT